MQRRLLHAFARNATSSILHLSPLVRHFPAGFQPEAANPECEWHSPRACVQAAEKAVAAAVWLGGTEPLFHPAIGEVTAALANAGYYVFLHTSGVGLRKRIHEFEPVDRLYLAFEIPTDDARNPQGNVGPGASLATVAEAMRVAGLSGFHLCAHFTATESTLPAAVIARSEALQQYLDGMLVSSSAASAQLTSSAANRLAEITQLIPSSAWRSFSRHLQAAYQPAQPSSIPALVRQSGDEGPRSTPSACEESA